MLINDNDRVAQLVERMTFNYDVVGSSPTAITFLFFFTHIGQYFISKIHKTTINCIIDYLESF